MKCAQVESPEIGNHAQIDAEEVHQAEREEEGRQRLAGDRKPQRDAVDHRVGAQRRQNAERNGERQREGQRQDAQRRGDRHVLGQDIHDVHAQVIGAAEIALQETTDPVEILQDQRPVETEEFTHRRDVAGRSPLAGHRRGGIAGHVDEQEGDHRSDSHHEKRHQQAFENEEEH